MDYDARQQGDQSPRRNGAVGAGRMSVREARVPSSATPIAGKAPRLAAVNLQGDQARVRV